MSKNVKGDFLGPASFPWLPLSFFHLPGLNFNKSGREMPEQCGGGAEYGSQEPWRQEEDRPEKKEKPNQVSGYVYKRGLFGTQTPPPHYQDVLANTH